MLFSIVVPCYNVEKYIKKCVLSILEQSYKEYELILVDDGSTDETPKILDSFAERNSKIKIIHKINGGLTSARKAGSKEAVGDYIVPVDGDDWIEPDYLSSVADGLKNQNIDLICCGYYEANKKTRVERYPISGETRILLKEEKEELIYKDLFHFFPNVWAKVYKRELYLRFQLSLDDKIIMGEDGAINFPLLMQAKDILYIKKPIYNYRLNPNSLTKNSKKYVPWEATILRIERMKQLIPDCRYNMNIQIACYVSHALFTAVSTHINTDGISKTKKQFEHIIKENPGLEDDLQLAMNSNQKKEKIAAFLLNRKMFYLIKIIMNLK